MWEVMVSLLNKINVYEIELLISDTFTLVAGFVAIGIPLSLQLVERAAEKYKSKYLIAHLSTLKWLTPRRLIQLSTSYIFCAAALKYFVEPGMEIGLFHMILAWIVVFLFTLLMVVTAVWYVHLYTQLQKRVAEVFHDIG